jgi:cholest-4-en-3-one 26-monooxygenase
VCERGTADFVEEISAELPLLVIAELLGVPPEDRRMVFDWSNRMIGSEDPEYQVEGVDSGEAAMAVYAYAEELATARRLQPTEDLVSVLLNAEVEGEKLNELELDLFFLLLIVAGNETTRNLMSGAMTAFFNNPGQWDLLRQDRSLLPTAVEEMLRFVTPVMHFRRTATADFELHGQEIKEGDKVVFWHTSANRDENVFDNPDTFDVTRSPNNHIAFGGGGPHFCLGANLARMEIMVMFDRLLERMPDMRLDGEVQRLQSNFINGTKHIPIAFAPSAPVGGTPLPARAR